MTHSTDEAPAPDLAQLEAIAHFMRGLALHRVHWGLSGHLAMRVQGSTFAINPTGVPLGEVAASQLKLHTLTTGTAGSPPRVPGLSTAQILAENAHLNCALHLHMPHAHAWSAIGLPLPGFTTDTVELIGRQTVQDPFAPPAPLDPATRIIWHRHHGLTALGESWGEAGYYLLAAERGAREQLLLAPVVERFSVEEAPANYADVWKMTRELAENNYAVLRAEAEARR